MTPSARSLAAAPNSSLLGASAPNNTRRQNRIEPRHRRGSQVTFPSRSRAAVLTRGHRARRIFADMLWQAFPLDSETAIAERAAPVLDLAPRHVRRLLRCEHDAKIKHFLIVAALIGVEAALTAIYGED